MGFKENLKDEISYQGMTLKEVAAKAGVNPASISNYLRENSSIPAADIAVRIADALNTSVEFLVTGTEKSNSSKKTETYSATVRSIADKIETFTDSEQKIVSVLVDEIARQK